MRKFKVGDKVICVDAKQSSELAEGRKYIVNYSGEDCFGNNVVGLEGRSQVHPVYFTPRFELAATSEYSLKKFEKDIRKFNERCGNVDCTPEMSLADTCATVLPQAKVILEEAKELLKACEEKDEQEILDGSIDILVTSLRLLSLLGKRYDLMRAAELVMENNHLKYTDDVKLLEQWVVASPPDIYGESSEVGGKKYYYLKDLNGKIRKWVGFPKVELNVEVLRK